MKFLNCVFQAVCIGSIVLGVLMFLEIGDKSMMSTLLLVSTSSLFVLTLIMNKKNKKEDK